MLDKQYVRKEGVEMVVLYGSLPLTGRRQERDLRHTRISGSANRRGNSRPRNVVLVIAAIRLAAHRCSLQKAERESEAVPAKSALGAETGASEGIGAAAAAVAAAADLWMVS